jgi:16S rRNA (cytosine967-C5)-methyltransferase
MIDVAEAGMAAVQATSAVVVGQVLSGKNLDRVLEAQLGTRREFKPGDRSAVRSISFDTLRHYGLLSAQLDILLTQPAADAPVRHLLLVALAQLQFSRAAPHAIVDHAVEAIGLMGFARAKPLANAVLRSFLRSPEKFKRARFKNDVARYDFPRWWVERTKKEIPASWQSTLLSAREHPPMWLRLNVRRTSADAYRQLLSDRGIVVRMILGNAVLLETPLPVHDLPGFDDGLVSVQDVGAQLAAGVLAPTPGMRVLDACSAPGGKAGHLLERADIELTALDSDSQRLARVAGNLKRLGLSALTRTADATQLAQWWDGVAFDRILLDVPCSGSGVVRRHPDIKWIRRESDIASFAKQQRALLGSLWQCLGNGGRLLYATCSIFRAENNETIEQFLRERPDARQLPISAGAADEFKHPGEAKSTTLQCIDGQLLPDNVHDGFFYALLEKLG